LFSQIFTSGTLAVGNFVLYNLHIFRTDTWQSRRPVIGERPLGCKL
jgi:hypothetical protein